MTSSNPAASRDAALTWALKLRQMVKALYCLTASVGAGPIVSKRCGHRLCELSLSREDLGVRLEFRALDGGFEDEDDSVYCLIFGVKGKDADGVEHYLNFQRGFEDEDPAEDAGVHCEFDDQINGAYNCVSRCRLTRTALEVELSRPIDWQKKFTSVSVDVSALDDATWAAMRGALPRIFRGTDGVLEVAEPGVAPNRRPSI